MTKMGKITSLAYSRFLVLRILKSHIFGEDLVNSDQTCMSKFNEPARRSIYIIEHNRSPFKSIIIY